MWAFVVVVLDEFPVEWESGVFLVVGSESTFDLSECGWFADASEDMLDLDAFTVCVEAGFASAYAPELRPMICEDLSWFRVFMNSLVK